jgi:hypothetical protein
MPFVDGEPIDAAKLGALETQLNQLKSSIPTFGSSNISLNTSTTNNVISSGPELEAANTPTFELIPGSQNIKDFQFKKDKGFSKTPVVVACGRYGPGGKQTHGDINVVSVSQTGFSISCPLPSTGVKHTIGINYIAIAY